jgi:hypothetical protein
MPMSAHPAMTSSPVVIAPIVSPIIANASVSIAALAAAIVILSQDCAAKAKKHQQADHNSCF